MMTMARRNLQAMVLALILLTGLFVAGARAGTAAESTINYYRGRYGTVARGADPWVEDTFRVFDQLRAIAGGIPTVRLEVMASSGSPWALALPDGYCVLSLGAVQRCYQGVDRETGEARIAFVVGHELAHLAKNDFWHQESFFRLVEQQGDPALLTSLAGASDLLVTTPPAEEKAKKRCLALAAAEAQRSCLERLERERQTALKARQGKELAADDQGFLYAAMAGYPVDRLVAPPAGEDDFLAFWVRQTGAGEGGTHPSSGDRVALLRNRLQELAGKVELFKFGVRHAAFGRYEAAITFFDQFRQLFPSREVLNNLGYCHLAKAMAAMPATRAYHYWLPLELGFATRMDTFAQRGAPGAEPGDDLPSAVRADLRQALQLLRVARERDETYLPTLINLAAALFYQGELFEARAAVEHALRLAPDHLELRAFKALLQVKEEPSAGGGGARQLRELAGRADCPPAVRFNAARVLEEAREPAAALEIWRALALQGRELPAPFRRQVVTAAGGDGVTAMADGAALPWPLPAGVTMGRDIVGPEVVASLFPRPRWLEAVFAYDAPLRPAANAVAMSGRIFTHRDGDRVLAVDDFVEMVVLKGGKLGTAQGLRQRCGPPFRHRSLAEGELWSYGPSWMALVKDDAVTEVWVARLQ